MSEDKKRSKAITYTIILLILLLAVSITALVALFLRRGPGIGSDTVATVPDNVITPDHSTSTLPSLTDPGNSAATDPFPSTEPTDTAGSIPTDTAQPGPTRPQKVTTLRLNNRQSDTGIAFTASNLFPGDRETKTYQLEVSYHDSVTVNFHADVRSGYEHLAKVLCVKITTLPNDTVLYDGPMLDMPAQISQKLSTRVQTTRALSYTITAYLDTSVGNEYQNAQLIADFRWWVTEAENLGPPDKTWDDAQILLVSAAGLFSGTMLVLFATRHKGKENENV